MALTQAKPGQCSLGLRVLPVFIVYTYLVPLADVKAGTLDRMLASCIRMYQVRCRNCEHDRALFDRSRLSGWVYNPRTELCWRCWEIESGAGQRARPLGQRIPPRSPVVVGHWSGYRVCRPRARFTATKSTALLTNWAPWLILIISRNFTDPRMRSIFWATL